MGWISQRKPHGYDFIQKVPQQPATTKLYSRDVEHIEHIEHIEESNASKRHSPDLSKPENGLPFIPPDLVREQSSNKSLDRIWLVVDGIVYDCTRFIAEHPGGDTVIRSFIGQDCSWQFWRFHSASTMEEFGRPLRIGRTEGIQNRFPEPPRYFGLRGVK